MNIVKIDVKNIILYIKIIYLKLLNKLYIKIKLLNKLYKNI